MTAGARENAMGLEEESVVREGGTQVGGDEAWRQRAGEGGREALRELMIDGRRGRTRDRIRLCGQNVVAREASACLLARPKEALPWWDSCPPRRSGQRGN